MEKKSRGVKKGETPTWDVGRKKGTGTKTFKFLGFRVTEAEHKELTETFENYKKRNSLTTTEAIKKIILEKK